MKERLSKVKLDRGSLTTPKFARDLYSDLRDRRLLPLVAVLLVAIAAMPFLLDASDPELTDTTGQANLAPSVPDSARLEVVADVPTLRDYRDRLETLTAKDPFRQHFTAPRVAGANLGGGTTSTTSTTVPTYSGSSDFAAPPADDGAVPIDLGPTPTTTTPTIPQAPDPPSYPSYPTGNPGGGSNGSGGGGQGRSTQIKIETKFISYRMTARLGAPGKIKTRRLIPELTILPNEENPLAVFLGVSADTKKALLLVSTDVSTVFGDVRCGFGEDQCQLLKVEPGLPIVMTYGPDNKKFRLTVTRIERVEQARG